MNPKLNRRDFLKLVSLLPLLGIDLPYFSGAPEQPNLDPNAQNVLILLFDTWSARHLSLYGYQRETTPNLTRLAEKATVYHNHYAGGSFTTSGTASLLTGTHPWTHRAFNFRGTVTETFQKKNIFSLFAEQQYHRVAYTHNQLVNTLLNEFRGGLNKLTPMHDLFLTDDWLLNNLLRNDYDIASDSEFYLLHQETGFNNSLFFSRLYHRLHENHRQDIDERFGDLFPRGIPNIKGRYYFLLEEAIDWIQTQLSSLPQPYLAYYHLLPPHDPYNTRQEFMNVFRDGWIPVSKPEHFFSKGVVEKTLVRNRRLYDEFILYVDAEFGRLYDFMQKTGALDNTWVVLTSDHGELFERGILGHTTETLHEPLIQVPLLVFPPGQQTRIDVHTPTSCIDLLPTLLQVTGQTIPDWCEGEVLPPFSGADPDPERPIFVMDGKENLKLEPLKKASFAIRKGHYKLMFYSGFKGYHQRIEVHNLETDPEELINLAPSLKAIKNLPPEEKVIIEELYDLLKAKIQAVNEPYR